MTPEDSPLTLEDVMSSPAYQDLMTPDVAEGDRAPDFTLPLLDGSGSVTLSEHDRPVALVFGSYT